MKKSLLLFIRMSVRRKGYYAFLCLSLFIFIFNNKADSQDNTLYNMHVIPQANQLNPAIEHPCRVYVALPVISSFRLNLRNTGFGFHDVLHNGTGDQSDTYYLDLANLDKKLWRMNYFNTNLDIDLLGFGFALKDWYFTFGFGNHTELRFAYPHDIASLKDGNWNVNGGKAVPISLNGLGIDLMIWNSIGISASKEVMEGLRAGVRLKYLQGMANINTRRSRLELNTTSDPVTLGAEMKYRLNASFPVKLGYASNGLINAVNFDNSFNNIPGDFIFNGNRGLGIDAGVLYDINVLTRVSASITDIGFIWWKKNVNNFESSGKYTFDGIDLDRYQANPGQVDFLQAMEDTLLQAFTAAGSVKTNLTLNSIRIFGGITREFTPKFTAGAMTRIEFYDLRFRPSLTLSANYSLLPSVLTTLSYTVMNNKFDQVGTGLAIGKRGVQFYLLTDNIPVRFTSYDGSPVIWPYNARMLSLRFGFNLLFGCSEKNKEGKSYRKGRSKICPAYW